jgi:MarR family transcriptional regulator, organic hydroperoxide resistance regulator
MSHAASGARRQPARPALRERTLSDVLTFMQLLWAVTHGLESASKRMKAELGVTGPQRLVLRLIGEYGVTAPGELASVLHVDPSSLTGVLRRLERSGLIGRARDPNDGRRAVLSVTRRGQAINRQRRGTVEARVQAAMRGASARQLTTACRVLKSLAHELGVE